MHSIVCCTLATSRKGIAMGREEEGVIRLQIKVEEEKKKCSGERISEEIREQFTCYHAML